MTARLSRMIEWRRPSGLSSTDGTRGTSLSAPARTAAAASLAFCFASIGGASKSVEQLQDAVDVVDLERAGHVRAAQAELARRAQHVAERDRRADREDRAAVPVGGRQLRPVPQGDAERPVGEGLGEERAKLDGAQAASAYLVACRSGEMRTTSQTSPTFSIAVMTHAEGSISQRPMPCAADVGNAWWLLCHASPIVSGASHIRLRDSSFVANLRRPKKWQSELIEYVEWCRTRTRTAPPHSRPVKPSRSVPPNA